MQSGKNEPRQQTQPSTAEVGALVALFNVGRHADAENRARSLLALHPDAGHVWKRLSLSLHMQGKDPLFALQRASYLWPDDAGVHNNLGRALHGISHPNWHRSTFGIYRFWRDLAYGISGLELGIAAQFSGSVQAASWSVAVSMLLSGGIPWLLLRNTLAI